MLRYIILIVAFVKSIQLTVFEICSAKKHS